jgi:hypothetical protein
MARWWTLEMTAASFSPSFAWKQRGSCLFIMEKGCLALKQRESIHFGDFWHTNDDFVQLNTTKTIFKAEKAQSY